MAVKPPEVECEYRTDQDEISASDLEDAECKDSDKEASDTDTENQAEHNEAGFLEIEDDGIDVVVQGDDNGATFEEESEHLGHVDIDLEADVSKLSAGVNIFLWMAYLLTFMMDVCGKNYK
eukprot:Em0022g990a